MNGAWRRVRGEILAVVASARLAAVRLDAVRLAAVRLAAVMVGATLGVALLGACAPGAGGGRVVLIGGGLEDDNAAVLGTCILAEGTARALVVPWASGDQAGAGASTSRRLQSHAPGARVSVAGPDLQGEAANQLAAELAQLESGDLVYFTGGDQKRITQRLLAEDGGGRGVLEALRAAHAKRGVTIGGTSAGAACMSSPMFLGGQSDAALGVVRARTDRNPAAADDDDEPVVVGPRLGPGLGLVQAPGGVIVDTHFLERGRIGRLIAALEASGTRWGVGLNENRAVLWEGAGADALMTAIGDQAAVLVDASSVTRRGLSRFGARVSVLSDGDTWTAARGVVTSAPAWDASTALVLAPAGAGAGTGSRESADRATGAGGAGARRPAGGPWARNGLRRLLAELAAEPRATHGVQGTHFRLVVRADERTRFAGDAARPGSLRVIDAVIDIEATGER